MRTTRPILSVSIRIGGLVRTLCSYRVKSVGPRHCIQCPTATVVRWGHWTDCMARRRCRAVCSPRYTCTGMNKGIYPIGSEAQGQPEHCACSEIILLHQFTVPFTMNSHWHLASPTAPVVISSTMSGDINQLNQLPRKHGSISFLPCDWTPDPGEQSLETAEYRNGDSFPSVHLQILFNWLISMPDFARTLPRGNCYGDWPISAQFPQPRILGRVHTTIDQT